MQKLLRDHVAAIPDLEDSTTQNLMSPLPTASDLFGTAPPATEGGIPSAAKMRPSAASPVARKTTIAPFVGARVTRYDPEAVNRRMAEDALRAVEGRDAGLETKKAKQDAE